METQKCSMCREEKPITDYTHRKRECRVCRNIKGRSFYNVHKERILDDKKQYREENRGMTLRKVTCDCGAVIANNNLVVHKRSQKHLKYVVLKERTESNKLWQITYYDEEDGYKQNVVWVTEERYNEFHRVRNYYVGSNYNLIKEMELI